MLSRSRGGASGEGARGSLLWWDAGPLKNFLACCVRHHRNNHHVSLACFRAVCLISACLFYSAMWSSALTCYRLCTALLFLPRSSRVYFRDSHVSSSALYVFYFLLCELALFRDLHLLALIYYRLGTASLFRLQYNNLSCAVCLLFFCFANWYFLPRCASTCALLVTDCARRHRLLLWSRTCPYFRCMSSHFRCMFLLICVLFCALHAFRFRLCFYVCSAPPRVFAFALCDCVLCKRVGSRNPVLSYFWTIIVWKNTSTVFGTACQCPSWRKKIDLWK